MMKVTNNDMIKAAKAHDVDMLKSCVECGAWMDFVTPDDTLRNTALHWAIQECKDYADYLADAEKLGLKVDPDKGCDLVTKLKPRSREAKKQLQEDINAWNEQHKNDIECVESLCEGRADPNMQNAEGKTPFEMARTKDPAIIKALEAQIEMLEDLAKEDEENA
jgi:ankyrin repeat protein